MPVPVIGHHDSSHVRMISEIHSEEVKNLPLIPVGARPDTRYRIDVRIVAADFAFQPYTAVLLDRVNQINDLEPRLERMPVDSGDAAQSAIEGFPQKTANIHDRGRLDVQHHLAALYRAAGNPGSISIFNGSGNRKPLPHLFGDHLARLPCSRRSRFPPEPTSVTVRYI